MVSISKSHTKSQTSPHTKETLSTFESAQKLRAASMDSASMSMPYLFEYGGGIGRR